MDYSPIRTYDSNHDAPWYREYLVMSPALIIIALVFGIFLKLMCYRRFLTREIAALASIEVPPPREKKNRTTQTGLDSVVIVYDGPSTSKVGEAEEQVKQTESTQNKGAMYVEPMCIVPADVPIAI